MSDIEQQVHALRKQVRRQRGWNITLIGTVLIGGLLAATSDDVPDVIKARKFELIGSAGTPLAELKAATIEGEEFGSMRTMNGRGSTLVEISQNHGKGSLMTKAPDGRRLVYLTFSEKTDAGGVLMYNSAGNQMLFLGSTRRGDSGNVVTYNPEGKPMVSLMTKDLGKEGLIRTNNNEGQTTSTLP